MSLDYRIEIAREDMFWSFFDEIRKELIADGMDALEADEHAKDMAQEKLDGI